jgi:hypothetical protein
LLLLVIYLAACFEKLALLRMPRVDFTEQQTLAVPGASRLQLYARKDRSWWLLL